MNSSGAIKKWISAGILAALILLPLCADSATVVSLKGKVEVDRNGSWIPLAENDTVAQGEIISTGFKSEAVLQYQGSTIQLGPLTRITLETLAKGEKKDTVSVYLNTGAVKSSVKKTENKRVNYTVHNPVAVASVRGTEFGFSSDGSIDCTEGAVVAYPGNWYDSAASVGEPSDGQSSAGTAAGDIAPGAPVGAVVVLPGQGVSVGESGFNSRPADTASEKAGTVLNALNTPIDTESVATGSPSADSQLPSVPETTSTGGTQKTGKIKVVITVQ
jgi:hypothetical protein